MLQTIARNGSGFVAYQYENPVTGSTEPKLAYVKRIDDTWWLASGIYGSDLIIPMQSPEVVREILKAKVDYAVEYANSYGKQEALAAFNNVSGLFAANGTYIFAFDMDGTTLAMPFEHSRIGINERNLTDLNGVSIGGEKLRLAHQGGGYFYYVYTNPSSGVAEFKVSYVKPVDSQWVVGAGTYLPDIPVTFPRERRDRLVAQVSKAAEYVRSNGRAEAIAEFNDLNGNFSDQDMYVFAFDRNGTYLASPYLPGLIGMNRLQDRDVYGEYPVPYIIKNAEQGGGFMYYFFADPATNYTIRTKLGYSQMAGDDLIVGAGIFSLGDT
jgi:polar amino acid transport system substrate-binding protein